MIVHINFRGYRLLGTPSLNKLGDYAEVWEKNDCSHYVRYDHDMAMKLASQSFRRLILIPDSCSFGV